MYTDLTAAYNHRCPQCGGVISLPSLSDGGPYDELLDYIARQLYTEKVSKGAVPMELYKKTADDLLKAMDEGLGGTNFDINDGRNTLKAYFQQNICAFSAAKSLTEMNHMRSLLADATDFTDFRNKCFDAGYQFNVNWLKTEYETFTASAQMAQQWDMFKREGVDVLEYVTAGDERVRAAHAALDGLTLPIDSPVIRRIYPPTDWGCRCHMIPGVKQNITDDSTAGKLVKANVRNPMFQHHAGIDKVVISDDHPYFNAAPKELDAQKNYGLKSVKHLYNQNKFPARIEMGSEQEYKDWWRDMPKERGKDDIVLKDKTGVAVLFDSQQTPGNTKSQFSYFKDHILLKSNENRWSYAANLVDIVSSPDELWSIRDKGKVVRFYIKYFDNAPITVVAVDKAGTMTAETMYELTEQRAADIRRGELIYINR